MSVKSKASKSKKASDEESLSQQAYRRIRNKILRGDVSLGTGLPRRQLAEEFGMSVLPISEALQRLELEGLVESQPRIGTRVRIPSPIDVRGHMLVREALESQAARLFAVRATKAQREELLQRALELDGFWDVLSESSSDYHDQLFRVHDVHSTFHMRIAECTGYPALCQAIERNQVLVFVWLYDLFLGPEATPKQWHRQLMESLCGHDPIKADEAMREHVRAGVEEFLQRLEPFLQWDEEQLKKATRVKMNA